MGSRSREKGRGIGSYIWIALSRTLLWPFLLLDRTYHVLLFAASSRKNFGGFILYSIENDSNFFDKAIAALEKLKQIDPRRYERARRLMPIIAHVRQGGNFYKAAAHAFYVDECPDDIPYFASEIVHETTHAHLLHKGFRYDKEVRERHERICAKEQFAFIVKTIRAQTHATESQKEALSQQWSRWFDEHLASQWWHGREIRRSRFLALKKLIGELFDRNSG